MTCFLDLDGVLVDFVKGALDYWDAEDFVVDHWDFDKTLSAKLKINVEYFWGCLDQGFWEALEWTPDGKDILAACEEKYGGEVYLLTSPCATEGCAEGKTNWVKRNLPQYQRKLFIGSAKHAFASPDKTLVDDSDTNVKKFSQAGGKTVLVPRAWNEMRHLKDSAASCVKERLKCA
jgi:5'(3')-deoxyribonucleotidase